MCYRCLDHAGRGPGDDGRCGIPECAQAAECKAGEKARREFGLNLGDAANGALIVMGATLAKDLIVELVKRALSRAEQRRGKRQAAEEVVVEQVPDRETGLPLFRVGRKKGRPNETSQAH
jgi:hypothetical protein